MIAARSTPTRPRGLARLLAVALLVLSYAAQPALALACGDHDCATATSCCCAPVEPAPAATSGCCAEDESGPARPEPSDEEELCACRVQPVDSGGGAPVLPAPRGEGVGDASPAEWVRAHQERSVSTPVPFPPEAGASLAGGEHVPRPGVAPGRASPHGPSGGSWTLLARGVDGLLAVLMVARI